MIALVRGVIAASILSRSMLRVTGSMSANTGVAPTSRITFAVATQEIGVVMTSSPGAYARDAQRDLHRAGAGIEGAHRTPAEIGGKLFLEFLHLGAAGDPAGAQHVADRGDGGFVYRGFGKGKESYS